MLGSEENNTRKIKSGKVGLATLVEGTETTSDRHLVTRNLPDSSTFFVKITLDPLVTNLNPFYKNFAVLPNPLVTSQTRIMPCFLTSNDPVSAFRSKQSQMSSNVGVICSIHGNSGFLRLEDTRKPGEYSCSTTRHGRIFKVVNMFINDCILELPGRNVNSSSSSAKYLENYKFLEYCYDCNKALDGNEIYMYSDKSFCSNECREKKFMNDSNLKKAEKNVY